VATAERSGTGRKRQLRWKHYYSLAADSPTKSPRQANHQQEMEQQEQQEKIRILLKHCQGQKTKTDRKERREKQQTLPSVLFETKSLNQSTSLSATLGKIFFKCICI
jgi:hypothetical protein